MVADVISNKNIEMQGIETKISSCRKISQKKL